MKKLLSTIFAFLCLCSCVGAATTLTQIAVRDTDKKVDTATVYTPAQFTATGTLYQSQLPAHWTLDFLTSHTDIIHFSVNGGTPLELEATPYCPAGHNTPLNLAVGDQTISITIASQAPQVFRFTLAASPPVAQSVAELASSSFGINLPYACNDPRLDISKYPELVTAARAMKAKTVRAWLEYPTLVQQGDAYWSILKQWKAAGFRIGIQYQGFQDQNPKYSMPPKAVYMDAVNRMVASGIVSEIYWANEIDSTSGQVYYNGALDQMATMLADVAPVAKAAGILNVAPSFVHGNNFDQKLNAAGIYAHMDAVDQHFYSTEAANQAAMVAWATRAASYGKKCYSTEFGFTGSGQGHADAQKAALNSLRSLGGTYFPWVYIPHPSGYASPLDVNANPINPEYGAWVAGMGG